MLSWSEKHKTFCAFGWYAQIWRCNFAQCRTHPLNSRCDDYLPFYIMFFFDTSRNFFRTIARYVQFLLLPPTGDAFVVRKIKIWALARQTLTDAIRKSQPFAIVTTSPGATFLKPGFANIFVATVACWSTATNVEVRALDLYRRARGGLRGPLAECLKCWPSKFTQNNHRNDIKSHLHKKQTNYDDARSPKASVVSLKM